MGEVILVYKILPEDPSKFENLKAELEKMKPTRLEEEPIGFGLSALKFTIMIPDEGGKQDELEKKLQEIDGIGDTECIHASRSM